MDKVFPAHRPDFSGSEKSRNRNPFGESLEGRNIMIRFGEESPAPAVATEQQGPLERRMRVVQAILGQQ